MHTIGVLNIAPVLNLVLANCAKCQYGGIQDGRRNQKWQNRSDLPYDSVVYIKRRIS